MIILLTNDDGIHAEGLRTLRREIELIPGAEVYVVAPDKERSASGHGITIHEPLRVQEIREEGGKSRLFAVSGTPADCTKIGVKVVLPAKPALVISGINRGPNLGTDVLYSGTVAAALEAAVLGIPAVAVSLNAWENLDYTYSAEFASCLARTILQRGLTPNTLLNVNVPAVDFSEIRGVEVTKLGERRYNDEYDRRVDADGNVFYWTVGGFLDAEVSEGTDVAAVQKNKVSITPIHLDMTAHWAIEEICGWNIDLPRMESRS